MAFWGGPQVPTTQLLEVTVDRCYNLENRGPFETEYSCVLSYGGSMRRTQPCFGRGTHPVFEEKFVFEFTETVVELNIWVLATQPPRNDELIGFLRVQLPQVHSDGYVDSTWTLQRTDGSPAGSIRLTLQFPTSSSTFQVQRQDSNYTAPTLDSTPPLAPAATQPPILYQLLPYDAAPPPRPTTLDSTPPLAPAATQPPILYQLLPYDAAPPPRPTQPNATGPTALWSQLLPAAPACGYNPTTSPPPPLGYPLPPFPIYPPNPPGSGLSSDIYPRPPR